MYTECIQGICRMYTGCIQDVCTSNNTSHAMLPLVSQIETVWTLLLTTMNVSLTTMNVPLTTMNVGNSEDVMEF